MEEHDGEELAGFGEDEGYVVDVGERGIAEWRGERGGYRDENKREEDGAIGEYGWCGCCGSREEKVGVACERGERGLNGIEEDGVGEAFWRGGGTIFRCGDAFLEEGP